ncbi:MAG: hypothetical protein KJZ74_04195 [Gemmatimonadales bacterium]|nr:hypothetical protein [Gemmatimonadota bacterium]MCL4213091.1 hypothetical protein [Gemmatimonadales bacterium]
MRRAKGRMPILLGVLLCLQSCASETGSESAVFTLEPLFRIGQLEGPPEYALGQINRVLPAPDGGFYTCDRNDFVLRRYDREGKYVRTIGRRGQGPAEYDGCSDVDLMGDSVIVVSDPRSARFVFFRADGTFERVLGEHIFPGFGGGRDYFFVDRQARLWMRGALKGTGPPAAGEGEFGRTQFVILDPHAGRVDSVLVPGGAGSTRGLAFVLGTPDGLHAYVPPDTIWAVTRDGSFVVAGSDAYRIHVRPRSGAPREITRPSPPVPYEDEERAEWDAWREYFSSRQGGRTLPEVLAHKPAIRRLLVDDDGRLWVQPHIAAERRERPPRPAGDPRPMLHWIERGTFDLFELASGDFLGRLVLPAATQLMAVQGDRVWLAGEGEEGEVVISVHRLKAGSAAH